MTAPPHPLLKDVARQLGSRRLFWFGTRGSDGQPLLAFDQFTGCHSITSPLDAATVSEDCLETASRTRVDLDRYDVAHDESPEALAFRRRLWDAVAEPCMVVTYRATRLLSATRLTHGRGMRLLGMLQEPHTIFEHKPWVEFELDHHDVPTLPWHYYRRDEHGALLEALASGPLVLRRNSTSGGEGITLAHGPDDVVRWLPHGPDDYIAAAPYLEHGVPINVNACAFPDGRVTLHPASLQLIGLAGQTRRRFGYCGNDFAAVRNLDDDLLEQFERMTRTTGAWLARHGYVGAFGIDAMVHDGQVLLTEVNARFQGSSWLAARLDDVLGRPNQYVTHMAAFLGVPPPGEDTTLSELVQRQNPCTHALVHNTDPEPTWRGIETAPQPQGFAVSMLPARGTRIDPGGVLYRAVLDRRITTDGYSIGEDIDEALRSFTIQAFTDAPQQETQEEEAHVQPA